MLNSWVNAFYQFVSGLGYGHPIHAVLVHMPMGLITGAFLFSWVAFLFKKEALALTAYHCMALAFLFWFPVVLIGFMDWQHFYRGAWLTLIKIKMGLAGVLFILFLTALAFGYGKGVSWGSRRMLTICTICFFITIPMGYCGGELVYAGATQPTAQSYKAGENLFEANCSACHPNGDNTIKPGKPIKGSPKLKDLDTFISWIRHPVLPMPQFQDSQISASQAKELYQYIANVINRSGEKSKGL